MGEIAFGLQWPLAFFMAGMIPSYGIIVFMMFRCILDFVNHALLVPHDELHMMDMLAVPLKELLVALAWIRAVFSSQVNWRDSKLNVGQNGYLKGKLA